MNVYQMFVPIDNVVARRSAELHQARKCRICLSNRNLREIYTGEDHYRQQLIEQHSPRLLTVHELPRFICDGCEDVMIFYQTMVAKRERAESLMQSFVYGGGAWPEVQEMEFSDDSEEESDSDSETESESETLVEQRVLPVVKVEADSTTENVPDTVLRRGVEYHSQQVAYDPFERLLDQVMQIQRNDPAPNNEQPEPFDAMFEALLGQHQAAGDSNDSDDDVELVNEYNLNPF